MPGVLANAAQNTVKLQQLVYLREVVRHRLNITEAAAHLGVAQPGISRQIRQLEEELGVRIFHRKGKKISGVTEAGQQILQLANELLLKEEQIRCLAAERNAPGRGLLSIATTHTQARYVLPSVLSEFRRNYPQVELRLHQGSPEQISELAEWGEADLIITTEEAQPPRSFLALPCHYWRRCILLPRKHPLAREKRLRLRRLAGFPLVSYVFAFRPASPIMSAFQARGVKPEPSISATDSEVIKAYVRLGFGVGILARMAYDQKRDSDLVMLDADHLFPRGLTRIGFRRDSFLSGHASAFIGLFAPHLDAATLRAAQKTDTEKELEKLCQEMELPVL